jgi:putative peptide zinc metalloprotease protein
MVAAALPPLREDLALLPGPRDLDGGMGWMIQDPARGAYFDLSAPAVALLGAWRLGDPDRVIAEARRHGVPDVSAEDLTDLTRFLVANNLIQGQAPGMADSHRQQRAAGRKGALSWALHNYLFLRLPLVHPDPALTRLAPLGRALFSPVAGWLVLAMVALGIYLVGRQWDAFTHTFTSFLTLEGALWFGLALAVTKILHEMGHALAAKRFGCRVHSMGVAFLVMVPVLYTDVTDVWRLPRRRDRMIVGAAGMAVELSIAAAATLLWTLLPDGAARSAVFFLAAVSWVMTLAININPLMRFDGYYLLSDLIGVRNLQSRGFALARWHLRDVLFALGHPPPEDLPRRTHLAVLTYAYAAWAWRFTLFLSIAVLVYHTFFKLLGLPLMVVEIWWFLARPIGGEIATWWALRAEIRPNRATLRTGTLLAAGIVLAFIPWRSGVGLPTVMAASWTWAIHAPLPARIDALSVRNGQWVAQGDVLMTLSDPDLAPRIRMADLELDALQRLLARQSANTETMAERGQLLARMASTLARRAGLVEARDRLIIRAPREGRVTDLPPDLAPGTWIAPNRLLGRLISGSGAVFTGYARGEDLARLAPNAMGVFIPDDGAAAPIPVTVAAIAPLADTVLEDPILASTQGGPLPVDPLRDGSLDLRDDHYRVTLVPVASGSPPEVPIKVRGTARIDAPAESLAPRIWRRVMAILIRESDF